MAKLSAITTPSLTFDEGAAPGTPAANDVILYAKSDGLLYSKDDAGAETLVSGAGGAGGTTIVVKAADEAFSTTTANTSTGLGLSVTSGTTYRFRYVVFFTTNATTVGIKLGVDGPAFSRLRFGTFTPAAGVAAAGSAILHVSGNAYGVGTITPSAGPGATASMAVIEGIIVPSATGTLNLQHASETATATTILADSFGELVEV